MTIPYNFDKKPPIVKWLLALLAILALAAIVIGLPGCESSKKLFKRNADSTGVSRKESGLIDTSSAGSVKKNSSSSQENWDWWKTTVIPGARRDTNIYNFYNQPAGQAQAPVIIYEGGKGSKETQSNTIDSNWFKAALQQFKSEYDSTHKAENVKDLDKHTETKGLGLWAIAAIALGSYIGLEGIKKLFGRLFAGYSFVNPIQKKAS